MEVATLLSRRHKMLALLLAGYALPAALALAVALALEVVSMSPNISAVASSDSAKTIWSQLKFSNIAADVQCLQVEARREVAEQDGRQLC